MEAIRCFTRLELNDRVIHSKMYKRVTKRNSFTVAYKDGDGISYGQIEAFVKTVGCPSYHGAVVIPLEIVETEAICSLNQELNMIPVDHIVICHPPNNDSCQVISLANILELCVCIHFNNEAVFVAHVPNHFEKD